MLRAVWFLLKLAALAAVIVWFMRNPGTIEITWRGYIVETSVGFFAIAFAVFLFLYTHAHSIWRGFTGAPGLWRRYRHARRREVGYRSVTAGLLAVAAGDAQGAEKHAREGEKLIPDAPLARLLRAQSHLLNGETTQARAAFAELMGDSEAAFFGVKALLQESLRSGNHAAALVHAREAQRMQPGRTWIAKTLFGLEARNREWARAGSALKKCAKLDVFDKGQSLSMKQALLLAEADDSFQREEPVQAHRLAAKAFSLDPSFTPAALRLAKFYKHVGKTRTILNVVTRAFAAAPHPALAALWMEAAPARRKKATDEEYGQELYAWAQKLAKLNAADPESLKLLGAGALAARRFSEARDYMIRAQDYRGLAKLEEAESGDAAKAGAWLEQAADAPPEPKWSCGACGQVTEDWHPLCGNCGGFNTVAWTAPDVALHVLPYVDDTVDVLAQTG